MVQQNKGATRLVPLSLLIFLLQEDYSKAESEASKGREGGVGPLWNNMVFCGGQRLWDHRAIPFSSFGPSHSSFYLLSHFFGLSFSAAALTFSEAEAPSSTSVSLSSFGPQDLSLLLLPGDGGLLGAGADRASVCAQPLKRTVGMSKHFIAEAKPWRSWVAWTRLSLT